MSKWEDNDMTDHIRAILDTVQPEQTYGTGRPFMTTYQIAIAFNRQYPGIVAALNLAEGGEGQGPYALTNYIARWLPDHLRDEGGPTIELGFLAPDHLERLEFDSFGAPMTATTNQAGYNTTMFRLSS